MVPATLEMMDQLVIEAVEASINAGFPLDCATVLLIELDGLKDDLEGRPRPSPTSARRTAPREVRVAKNDAERAALWAGRRGAFGAVARSPRATSSATARCRAPPSPRSCAKWPRSGSKYDLKIPNVFHAGDGNLHPLILFDWRDAEQKARVMKAGMEILELCVHVGGTITGEHGVGLEKIDSMCVQFTPAERAAFFAVKEAFDPLGLLNPGKLIPTLVRCAEYGRMHVHAGRPGALRAAALLAGDERR